MGFSERWLPVSCTPPPSPLLENTFMLPLWREEKPSAAQIILQATSPGALFVRKDCKFMRRPRNMYFHDVRSIGVGIYTFMYTHAYLSDNSTSEQWYCNLINIVSKQMRSFVPNFHRKHHVPQELLIFEGAKKLASQTRSVDSQM